MKEADERGTLTIDDRVVERLAGYAVSQVPGTAAAPRRVLGVAVGDGERDRDVQVDARIDGESAVLKTALAVRWPMSIAAVVKDVRASVSDEVKRMTGITVDHVDVEVVSMSIATHDSPRVR